ncbi:ABC transporter permease [Candidatus Sumerlaeota bacterium]|nr:ABC transporter permease [Candidatus Sumerlaeota bacterium]
MLRKKDAGVTLSAVALFLIFALTSQGFLTSLNLWNVSRSVGFLVLIGLAQALVLVVGCMNLSVGAIGGLAAITTGYLITKAGLPAAVAAVGAIFVGLLAGAGNGLVITKLRINSFVVTLATLFIYTGLVFGFSQGYAYTDIPESFTFAGRKSLLGLPIVFWTAVATLSIAHLMFRHTVPGRHLLATGGNLMAARLSGINTDCMILLANMLSGLLAALTAALWVSRIGSAQPATGEDWLIQSFAVAILGGTGLSGGSISPPGLLMAAIIIALIKNGLVILEANVYYEQAFLGAIILAAVVVDRARGLWVSRSDNKE